jgi:hypothetical protein
MTMSKSRILYVLVAIPSLLGAAEPAICTLGTSYSSYDDFADQRPSVDAGELTRQVSAALAPVCAPACAPALTLMRNSTAPNLMLVREGGRDKLVYQPGFFTSVYETYGDPGILALVAHEMGHVIDPKAPPAWFKKDWSPELRADAWGGCALAKLSLRARALGTGLRTLAAFPSPAHPAWTLRTPVLRLGYTQCGGDGSVFDTATVK